MTDVNLLVWLFGLSFGVFLCLAVIVWGVVYLTRTASVPGYGASTEEMAEFLEDIGDL